MALKDILLHMDDTASCHSRLELAVNLARTHGAHLKGIYVLPHFYYAPRHETGRLEAAREAELLFSTRAAEAGISAEWIFVDWTVIGVSVTEILTMQAYYTDLVIVGQPERDAGDKGTPLDLPERLGLGAGRPLLVVPYTGTFATIGQRVMVAWKSGREAVRATHDALPIMEKASHVGLVTISPAGTYDHNDEENAVRICRYLARHGISAGQEQIQASSGVSVGDLLLNHACEQKMDLLVMGAYAQSRRGAFMLSPVARHLINYMTLPILLSH